MSSIKTYQNLLTALKDFGICPGQEVWLPIERVIYHSHQTTLRGAAPAKFRLVSLSLTCKNGKIAGEGLARSTKGEELKIAFCRPSDRLTYTRVEIQKVCDESNREKTAKQSEKEPARKPAKKAVKKVSAKKAAPKAKPCKKPVAKKPAKKSSK